MNWTIYLLKYCGDPDGWAPGAQRRFTRSFADRPVAYARLIWEKALVTDQYEVFSASAPDLEHLWDLLSVPSHPDRPLRAIEVGDVVEDETGRAWVRRGTAWESMDALWEQYRYRLDRHRPRA